MSYKVLHDIDDNLASSATIATAIAIATAATILQSL